MKLRGKSSIVSFQRPVLVLMLLSILTMSTIPGCSAPQKTDSVITVFARSVESCICNYLDIEDDNPSGLTYQDFIEDCNKTVRESHPDRFTDLDDSKPEIDSLRCPEKVESWQNVIAEQEQLRENNRKLMQELLDHSSSEDENAQFEE